MIRAFRDTWELGIHSYLSYMRDRLLLARDLLKVTGSIFVQISAENLHHVREVLDETFGPNNFVSLITFQTTSGFETSTALSRLGDYLLWYARDITKLKSKSLYEPQPIELGEGNARWVLLPNGEYRGVTKQEKDGTEKLPQGARLYKPGDLQSQGAPSSPQPFEFEGKIYTPNPNSHWKANYPDGMERLAKSGRIHVAKNSIQYRRFADDFPYTKRGNIWTDTQTGSFTDAKIYVVQTNVKVVERCIHLTTDPGDLVFDPTCGSGTTAFAAEKWGRRWITCDTSRVSIALTKQRLVTSIFDYYTLAHADEGVDAGFVYESHPKITLKSIANDSPPEQTYFYDMPKVDKDKVRVTGPLTVEAVPSPSVKSPDKIDENSAIASHRNSQTIRQEEWRSELLSTGIRGKGGQKIVFSRIEPMSGTRLLHAEGESAGVDGRIVVSFGPPYSPLDQKHVELALEEARSIQPTPKMLIFAAFQFDPEAAKDIDETQWPGITLLKVQINTDLLTKDLKKKRANNESYWLIGQPDVSVKKVNKGPDKGKFSVELHGFDYYNTLTGSIESGDKSKIAAWMLDPDYDGRSVFPRQLFLPMSGKDEGFSKLAKNLKAEIDTELLEKFHGTESIPFEPGTYKRVAVKIVDDRGIESLKILTLE